MQKLTVYMLKADQGKALTKNGRYCVAVQLGEGDDGTGWSEIPIEEARAARRAQHEARMAARNAGTAPQPAQGGAQ